MIEKKTKKFKKQAKPKKVKKINPTKFLPTIEELQAIKQEEEEEITAASMDVELQNETKKRAFDSDSENDHRKKRQKTEFSSAKKVTDAWCPDEDEKKILEEGESESSDFEETDVGFNAKELEAELLGLAGDPVNTRPYRVRPVDPETARARSHAKRNRLVGKPKSQYLGVSWCNKKQQWHGRVWVSHLKKLEWVGYFVDEIECALEVNKRCQKLGLPIKNPELEEIEREENLERAETKKMNSPAATPLVAPPETPADLMATQLKVKEAGEGKVNLEKYEKCSPPESEKERKSSK